MKRSSKNSKTDDPALAAILRLVDDEMSRIVAEIGAHRPPRPAPKSGRGRSRAPRARPPDPV